MVIYYINCFTTDIYYTKHYYAENERLACSIGNGTFLDIGNAVVPSALLSAKQAAVNAAALDSIVPNQFDFLRTRQGQWSSQHTTYWQHSDHLGSASWITDTSGCAVQHLQYMPWGEPLLDYRNSSFNTRYTFSGKERDEETGYSYFGARYYNSTYSIWMSIDPMSDKYPSISPYAYCGDNPVKLVDQDGKEVNPVYDCEGNFIANTKEGFTGDILIYNGNENIDLANMTKDEALKSNDVDLYDNQRSSMSNEAKSNIWTHIASQYEGLHVYDEIFSMSDIEDGRIKFGGTASWTSTYILRRGNGKIKGSDLYSYRSTVENIASSIIVHEWYSHIKKNNGDRYKSHRLAYKNVINYKYFWNKTTDDYKGFNVRALLKYTKVETGRAKVDPQYRYSYNKYSGYGKSISHPCFFVILDNFNDTTYLANGMDSICIFFWNLHNTEYDSYVFSFQQKSYTLTLKADRGESKLMKINDAEKVNRILQYVNEFYVLKSSKIIQDRIYREEIVSADYPTISIEIYKNQRRKISTHSRLEDDSYNLVLHHDFIHLWNILLEYINLYDEIY